MMPMLTMKAIMTVVKEYVQKCASQFKGNLESGIFNFDFLIEIKNSNTRPF